MTGALLIQDERRQNLPIAEAELRKALKILGAAKETYDVAWVYLNLAEATLLMGRPEDALTHLDQLLAAIHAAADPHAQAVVLCLKGRCLSEWLGEYQAAERHYLEAETLAGLFELPWKSYIRALLASVYEHEARYPEARESLASFLREYRFAESTFREARVTGLAWMARLCLLCHDVEAAEEYLREAVAAGPKKGSAAAMGAVAWAEGMLLSRRGDVAHADARFQIALKHLEPPGSICAYAHGAPPAGLRPVPRVDWRTGPGRRDPRSGAGDVPSVRHEGDGTGRRTGPRIARASEGKAVCSLARCLCPRRAWRRPAMPTRGF